MSGEPKKRKPGWSKRLSKFHKSSSKKRGDSGAISPRGTQTGGASPRKSLLTSEDTSKTKPYVPPSAKGLKKGESVLKALDTKPTTTQANQTPKLVHATTKRPLNAGRRPPTRKPRTADPKVTQALAAAKSRPVSAYTPSTTSVSKPPSAIGGRSGTGTGTGTGWGAGSTNKGRRRGTFLTMSRTTSAVKTIGTKQIMRIFMEDDTMKTLAITLPCKVSLVLEQMSKKMRSIDTTCYGVYEFHGEKEIRELYPDDDLQAIMQKWSDDNIEPKLVYKKRPATASPPAMTTSGSTSNVTSTSSEPSVSTSTSSATTSTTTPVTGFASKIAELIAAFPEPPVHIPGKEEEYIPPKEEPKVVSNISKETTSSIATTTTATTTNNNNNNNNTTTTKPDESTETKSVLSKLDAVDSASSLPPLDVAPPATPPLSGSADEPQRLDVTGLMSTKVPTRGRGRLPTLKMPSGGRGQGPGRVQHPSRGGVATTTGTRGGVGSRGGMSGARGGVGIRGGVGARGGGIGTRGGALKTTSSTTTNRGVGSRGGIGSRGVGAQSSRGASGGTANPALRGSAFGLQGGISRGGILGRAGPGRGGLRGSAPTGSVGAKRGRGGLRGSAPTGSVGGRGVRGGLGIRGGVRGAGIRGGAGGGGKGTNVISPGGRTPPGGATTKNTSSASVQPKTTSTQTKTTPTQTKVSTKSASVEPPKPIPVIDWTAEHIGNWLDSIDQGIHRDKFKKFSGKAVIRLKNEDVVEKLVGDISDAILIFQEIEVLRDSPPDFPPGYEPPKSSTTTTTTTTDINTKPSNIGPPPSNLGPPPSELGPPPTELGPPPSKFGQPPAAKKIAPPINREAKNLMQKTRDGKIILGVPPKTRSPITRVAPRGIGARPVSERIGLGTRGRGDRPMSRGFQGGRPARPARGMSGLSAIRGSSSRGGGGAASPGIRRPPLRGAQSVTQRGGMRGHGNIRGGRGGLSASRGGRVRGGGGGGVSSTGGRGAASTASPKAISTPVFTVTGDVKDNIARVFFPGGTYRSFLVAKDMTATSLCEQIIKKFKDESVELSGHVLFHILGCRERKLDPKELVLPLYSNFGSKSDKLVFKHESDVIVLKKEIVRVYLEDGTFKTLALNPTDTTNQLMAQVAKKTGKGPSGFSLWEYYPDGSSKRIPAIEHPAERKLDWDEGVRFMYSKAPVDESLSASLDESTPEETYAPEEKQKSFNPSRLMISQGGMMQAGLASAAAAKANSIQTKASTRKYYNQMRKIAFTRWFDYQLAKRDYFIQNLETDVCDGVLLINLLEILSGDNLGSYHDKPEMVVFEKLENLSMVFKYFRKIGINVGTCGPEDIADSNINLILSIVWQLIFNSVVSPFNPHVLTEGASKKSLLTWAQQDLKGTFPDLSVLNLNESWKDGICFCAIIAKHKPELINMEDVKAKGTKGRMELFNNILTETFAVEPLIEPITTEKDFPPDERSVFALLSILKELFSS